MGCVDGRLLNRLVQGADASGAGTQLRRVLKEGSMLPKVAETPDGFATDFSPNCTYCR